MPTIIKPVNNNTECQGNSVSNNSFLGRSENDGKDRQNKFREEDPKWELNQIVLRNEIRETLEEVITFCKHKDDILLGEWGLNDFLKGNTSIGVNFYGESGTGKSISAEAVANALGLKVIRADYSAMVDSKWGDTEKNLTALFQKAEATGSVIILNEADGLLSKRTDSSSTASNMNEVKSHLLTLVDRSNVIIFYTTNLFENFDKAFFRRILYHVNFPMPNHDEMVSLLKFHIGGPKFLKDPSNFSYDTIADMCVGTLAGGDIKNLSLRLCVKMVANKIPVLTNDNVKQEIDIYIKSLNDSKGVRVVPESDVPQKIREKLNEQ